MFLTSTSAQTLAEILALTGACAAADADPSRVFRRVASLRDAGPDALTALADESVADLRRTRAGACFVTAVHRSAVPDAVLALLTERPTQAFALCVAAFHPELGKPGSLFAARGVSPAAFVHSEARLEPDVTIDPGVVIGPGAEIGTGTTVGANSVIGPHVKIGRYCAIGAHVTIVHALIGNAVVLHPGVRVGQDGWDSSTGAMRGDTTFAGLGRVIIQDHAEVGGNATIDRGGLGDTVLGEKCRIDNLTHIVRDQVVARHALVSGRSPHNETPRADASRRVSSE